MVRTGLKAQGGALGRPAICRFTPASPVGLSPGGLKAQGGELARIGPFRATPQELAEKGEELTARGLPLVGELFHEAAGVYERRHLGA